jgi:hypothetical protein
MTTREAEGFAGPGKHEGRAETELTSNPASVAQARAFVWPALPQQQRAANRL